MMEQRRPLRVNILIVDDDETQVEYFLREFERHSEECVSKYWHDKDNGLMLTFRGLSPASGEGVEAFRERFRAIICCEEPSWRDFSMQLQAVIFDWFFKRPDWPSAGPDLALLLRQLRPNVNRALISALDLSKFRSDGGLFQLPVSKGTIRSEAGVESFLKMLIYDLAHRFETPLWSALRKFTSQPKIVMHAMAGADGRMTEVSVSADAFLDFFGLSYFQVEASSTAEPLDSLLSPHGSIEAAQEQFARAFGADEAIFVTNGTSTANKIVHAALLEPGDIVFVDRNCHISHHYAVALARAKPWYLEPFETGVRGVPGGIAAASVASALEDLIRRTSSNENAETARLPKLIALSNPTFDGHISDPEVLFRSVFEVLSHFDIADRLGEIAFLFDEAWFSFGRFHPHFCRRTALGTANNLCNDDVANKFWEKHLRLYVTQSVHKTGGAFRQASVVLVRDSHTKKGAARLKSRVGTNNSDVNLDRRLHQAMLCHTTTSPSVPILASLDVARRQFELEGSSLVQNALTTVAKFKELMGTPCTELHQSVSNIFSIATDTELLPDKYRNEFVLDPTKVTLRVPQEIGGGGARRALWNNKVLALQVNKFSVDSVLLMFMPGLTENMIGNLFEALGGAAAYMASDEVVQILTEHELVPIETFYNSYYRDESGEIIQYPDCVSAEKGLDLFGALFGEFSSRSRQFLITDDLIEQTENGTRLLIATEFIVPYPPGFPVVVPGQKITAEMLRYFHRTSHGEIHGLTKNRSVRAVDMREVEIV